MSGRGASPQVFRDRARGRPVFVIGGGTSLLEQDPAELEGAVLVGVNHAVWARERLGFPELDYWVFYDAALVREVKVEDYPGPRKLVLPGAGRALERRGFHPAGIETGEEGHGSTFVLVRSTSSGPISPDAEALVAQRSSLHGALHLARILGGDPIHVRGLDLAFGPDGRSHWFQGPGGRARTPLRVYQRMQPFFLSALLAVQAGGVRLTVGKGSAFEERFPRSIEGGTEPCRFTEMSPA